MVKNLKKAIRNITSAENNEHTERIFKSIKILKFSDQTKLTPLK